MTSKKSGTMDLAELAKCADQFHLAIMGDRSVGKSCLVETFVSGKFKANTHKTVSIYVNSKLGIGSWNTNNIHQQSEKNQKYVMQLLIPVLKRFAINAPSVEKLTITAATEIKPQVKKKALYEKIVFRKMQQNRGETIVQYATRLKQQARICNFGMLLDEHVRDQILGTCRSAELTERFFEEGGELTLEKLLEVGTLMEGNAVDEQSTGEMESDAEKNGNEDEENQDSDLDGESDKN